MQIPDIAIISANGLDSTVAKILQQQGLTTQLYNTDAVQCVAMFQHAYVFICNLGYSDTVMCIRNYLHYVNTLSINTPATILVFAQGIHFRDQRRLTAAGATHVVQFPFCTEALVQTIQPSLVLPTYEYEQFSVQNEQAVYYKGQAVTHDQLMVKAVTLLIQNGQKEVTTYQMLEHALGMNRKQVGQLMRIMRRMLSAFDDPIAIVQGQGYVIRSTSHQNRAHRH